jgi:hypothetical protein
MRNAWALPSPFQTSGEAINPGSWPRFWIPGFVPFCSRAFPPCVRVPDGQPLEIQSGLSGEVH